MGKTATVCLLTDERIRVVKTESRGRRSEIIARAEEPFRIPDSLLVEHDPEELADAVARSVREVDTNPDAVTLVVPLQWCFAETLTTTHQRPTAETLAYEFEEHLPLPIEDLTCAFADRKNGGVLALAIPTAPMRTLLEALGQRGIDVEHITTDAVAVAQVARSRSESSGVVILDSRWGRIATAPRDTERTVTGVFGVTPGRDPAATVREELHRRALKDGNGPRRWSVLDLADTSEEQTIRAALDQDGATVGYSSSTESTDVIANAVSSACPTLDLRTGPLAARGQWDTVLRFTEHCTLLALTIALIWIGGVYLHNRALQRHLAAVDRARLQTYRQVFDVSQLPPGAAMRLASERIRLEGLTRGAKGEGQDTPLLGAAPLDLLRDWVAALPADVRVLLSDARVGGNQLTLRGQTVKHRDAERMVEAIGTVPGLKARAPRTTRLKSGGVEFSITASVAHGE